MTDWIQDLDGTRSNWQKERERERGHKNDMTIVALTVFQLFQFLYKKKNGLWSGIRNELINLIKRKRSNPHSTFWFLCIINKKRNRETAIEIDCTEVRLIPSFFHWIFQSNLLFKRELHFLRWPNNFGYFPANFVLSFKSDFFLHNSVLAF